MDMQRILAALVKQAGGEILIQEHILTGLSRLAYTVVMKTPNGLRISVKEVPR